MRRVVSGFGVAFVLFWAGFALAGERQLDDKSSVFVSILPQKYFVEQIGKDLVDVQVMVQPGASPHTYEPRPQQMLHLAKTRVYFAVGVTFEEVWLKKIAASNPQMRVVHTDNGISKIPMTAHHHPGGEESHEKGTHEHEAPDPHVWLSPPLVMIQARNILTALQEVDPGRSRAYGVNAKAFLSRIVDLDSEMRQIFAGKQGLRFMVFHPAWGYFAKAYGLVQVPIETGGKDPKPTELRKLIESARARGIKVIFVQPQFSPRNAELVAQEIGGEIVRVDPLALNWEENLREVAKKFKAALQ